MVIEHSQQGQKDKSDELRSTGSLVEVRGDVDIQTSMKQVSKSHISLVYY